LVLFDVVFPPEDGTATLAYPVDLLNTDKLGPRTVMTPVMAPQLFFVAESAFTARISLAAFLTYNLRANEVSTIEGKTFSSRNRVFSCCRAQESRAVYESKVKKSTIHLVATSIRSCTESRRPIGIGVKSGHMWLVVQLHWASETVLTGCCGACRRLMINHIGRSRSSVRR
jgi:hypothetical protein